MSLAENRVVFGSGKQTAKGSPATATNFPRWGDGTMLEAALTTEKIREGDGSAAITRLIKNVQYWKGVIVPAHIRAIDLGFWLKALCGTLSDNQPGNGVVGTAWNSAKTATINAAVAVGATSVVVNAVTGTPVTNDWFQIGNGPNAEVRQATLVTGAGPYTLTVAALTNAHIVGEQCGTVNKYGTLGAISAGASGGSYTLVTGPAPVVNDIFTLDVNNPGATTTAETFKLTVVTGAGPYTLTFDHAAVYAHGAAAPCNAAFVAGGVGTQVYAHTFLPQLVRDYYTLIKQYALSTPKFLQVSDAQVHSMVLDAQRGKALKFQFDAAGIVGQDLTSAVTPSYDASSGLFLYYGGTFNVDGSLVGNVAPFITQAKFDYKHPLDDTMQTEAVTLADVLSTIREIQVDYEVLWQDFGQFEKTYFNAGGGPDSPLIGTGSIDLTFLAGGTDVNNSLEVKCASLHYSAAQLPPPKLSGKALLQKITATAVASPEMTFVLKNGQFLTY